MNKKLYVGSIAALVVLGALQIPVRQNRVLSYGVDAYTAHQPIYGTRTAIQTLHTTDTTIGLGAILVDLRRSKNLTDVTVDIKDASTKEVLLSERIAKEMIRDDEFAYTSFTDIPINKAQNIEITLSAPSATSKNPVGLRLDPEQHTAALALAERVPLWKFIVTSIQNQGNKWTYVSIALVTSLIIASAAFLPFSKRTWLIVLGLVAVAALGIRIVIIPTFGGVSGGDAYNYLSISDAIKEGYNPFANTKRLPGYPLLLTPFYASGMFDDQHVMRYMQSVSSIVGIILVAGIARALSLSWPTALLASAILAFQKDYFFTSTRPEPYTLYTALLLASLFFFIQSYKDKKIWTYLAFGLSLGYGAMVRQEGFMLAAVLGICSVSYELYTGFKNKDWRISLKRFVWMYSPALLLVLPFFTHNMLSYGHPLYTEYFEGDRLQIVDSYLAFQDSVGATWGIIGSMWKPSWESLERLPLAEPLFITSALALWFWYGAMKRLKDTRYTIALAIGASIVWVLLIFIAVYLKSSIIGNLTIITAAWTLASVPLFLIETKWRGAVVFLVLVSQILIATWFHPFPKHYQQAYPLIILMIATALMSQVPTHKKVVSATTLAASILPFLLIAILLMPKINTEIDRYNESVALDSVSYRASRAARSLPNPIGFDQAYLPARLYFDSVARYFPDEDTPTVQMEQEWLQNNPLKTIVVTNGNNVFKTIPESWKKIQEFKAAGKDEEMLVGTIYSLPE